MKKIKTMKKNNYKWYINNISNILYYYYNDKIYINFDINIKLFYFFLLINAFFLFYYFIIFLFYVIFVNRFNYKIIFV